MIQQGVGQKTSKTESKYREATLVSTSIGDPHWSHPRSE
jgi:hypothetical protein